MLSKAIERAQNTVEQRNAEIRKNVLEYDEVMNQQRKIIYQRRDQILDDADLREEAMGYLAEAVDGAISTFCVSDHADEWDVHGLHSDVAALWPVVTSQEQIAACVTTDELYELLVGEATAHYEAREAEFGSETMREIERQIMLQIIDQKWREHLYEMDYLQEGINLRAMGQKDPLVEWQREGFEMFGSMMQSVASDFVTYVMHAQITVAQPEPEMAVTDMSYSAPADPSEGSSSMVAAAQLEAAANGVELDIPVEAPTQEPVVLSEWDKTPRNAPCPCGSGKKFKLCHGK
jgi:preprotein translocase subunit SecA